MSYKLTYNQFMVESEERGHMLIDVSNPKHIREGTLTAICANNHRFTVPVKSYRACRKNAQGSKNGCPECKKNKTSQFWKGRVRKESQEIRSSSKVIKKKKPLNAIFMEVKNRQTLLSFLKNNENTYNSFIIQKIEEEELLIVKKQKFPEIIVQSHHIIPLHTGGPDEKWNLVQLELNDHIIAHRLRFEVYNEDGDERFLRFVDKNLNTNYFPKKVHKNQVPPIIRKKLQEGTFWAHPEFNNVLEIPPNAVELPSELYAFLLQYVPKCSDAYKDLVLTTKTSFSKGICRVLKKEGKSVRKWKLVD
jgi:hypothetical protein